MTDRGVTSPYNPRAYWEQRLNDQFNSRGVGHIGFSERYNYWLYRRKRSCLEAVFRRVPLAGKQVLDVGCGTGFFVQWYLEKGARVSGVDITDVSIERLRRMFSGDFRTQDITDPAYTTSGKKFDIVNAWDVFYHIVNDEAFKQALKNIGNSLKDGGLFLFTDFIGEVSNVRIADHVKGRSFATYRNELEGNNFQLVENRPLYHFLNNRHFGRFDNYLGRLYFYLDQFSRELQEHNVSLSVWRYGGPREPHRAS